MAKSRIISAIDVGSSKIATLVAQVRPEDESRLHVVGAASSVSRGVRKGQIVNIEEAVASIEESVEAAERMAGYNLTKAAVSVGGAHIGSLNSQGVVAVAAPQGEVTPADVKRVMEAAQAVSLPTTSEIIHVVPRSFTVDGQEGVKDPVGMTGVRLEVATHIVTGSTTALKNLTKCVAEVGCDVEAMVFSGLASAEAVLSNTEKELGVILIDIGGGTTDLAIFVEGALAYSQVLPVGAKNVTADLAIGLRVSLESAEKIKLALSLAKPKEDELDLEALGLETELKTVSFKTLVEGIIRPRLNELFSMVAAELKKSGFAGLTPSGLVVVGGGAMTVGVVESAKRVLSAPVRVGTPAGIAGLIDDIQSPAYATSVGLLHYIAKGESEDGGGRSWTAGLERLPGRGTLGKITDLIKSLLP